ncbi:MAG: hypothetical protein K6F32_06505 [Bacilli bacterium]|nr:hypothetical protein [Bacilli bacterium]
MPTKIQSEEMLNKNEEMFSKAIWDRGLSYYREGKVFLTFSDGKEVHADVVGSSKYSVRLDFVGTELKKAKCNCPYDRGLCKHEAAALMAFAYSDYEIEEVAVKPSLSDSCLTQRQFVTRLNLLLAREYNVNPERYYSSAIAIFEAGLANLNPDEATERLALIFFVAVNSKFAERRSSGAKWLIKFTEGRNLTLKQKTRIALKMSESFAYPEYHMALFESSCYRKAMGAAFATPSKNYDYPYSRLFIEKGQQIIDALDETELAALLNPSLRFPDCDLAVRRLFDMGRLDAAVATLSDDDLASLGMRDITVAIALMNEKPDAAKRILRMMYESYDCSFEVIYYLYKCLTPAERQSMEPKILRRADYMNCLRPVKIMLGEPFTPGSIKYLAFGDLLLLSKEIKAKGDAAKPYIGAVIRKHVSSALYGPRDFEKALAALREFEVDPRDGLLAPEFQQASYDDERFRVLYLKEANSLGILRSLGLRRHEV